MYDTHVTLTAGTTIEARPVILQRPRLLFIPAAGSWPLQNGCRAAEPGSPHLEAKALRASVTSDRGVSDLRALATSACSLSSM